MDVGCEFRSRKSKSFLKEAGLKLVAEGRGRVGFGVEGPEQGHS